MTRTHRPRRAAACIAALLAACTTIAPPGVDPEEAFSRVDHADFDAFLRRHVDADGRVDYAAARTDRDDLDRYLRSVAALGPDRHPEAFPDAAARLAYWIGAYNAWTLAMVLDAYPIASVNDVRNPLRLFHPGAGFFLLRRVTLDGTPRSLYAIENHVIRRRFDEPRIHFALNCASIGCPRLPAEAFVPDRLEAQLARETLRFLGESRNLAVDLEARVVRLSRIFAWYEEDFTGWMARHRPELPPTLLGWARAHAPPEAASRLAACADCAIEFVPYDWRLNDRDAD